MKTFKIDKLKPINGSLSATIFENKHLGIPPSLFFEINVALQEIDIDDERIKTSINLGFIKLKIHRLSELQNKSFDFPVNPEEGYIDGSIYLFHVHNPFDVTKIEFGSITGNTIKATLTYSIIFEFENTGYANTTEGKLIADLAFGQLAIDADILSPGKKNIESAKKLLAKFCDPGDYGEPNMDGGRIEFEMKAK